MKAQELLHIKDLLQSWGDGKWINKPFNGYPNACNFAKYILLPGDSMERASRPMPIPPELHSRLDAIVSGMKNTHPQRFEILCLAYIAGFLDHKIGGKMGLSRSSVYTMREAAEAWVEAKLDPV